jgi:hypothetical protein
MGVHEKEAYSHVKRCLGIPQDEPIFVLRAQDKLSPEVLAFYKQRYYETTRFDEIDDDYSRWLADVGSKRSDFVNWQRDNREKVKRPD